MGCNRQTTTFFCDGPRAFRSPELVMFIDVYWVRGLTFSDDASAKTQLLDDYWSWSTRNTSTPVLAWTSLMHKIDQLSHEMFFLKLPAKHCCLGYPTFLFWLSSDYAGLCYFLCLVSCRAAFKSLPLQKTGMKRTYLGENDLQTRLQRCWQRVKQSLGGLYAWCSYV